MLNNLFGPLYYLLGSIRSHERPAVAQAKAKQALSSEDFEPIVGALERLRNYALDLELRESAKRIVRIQAGIRADNPGYIAGQLHATFPS
jgi:hypothetical protein